MQNKLQNKHILTSAFLLNSWYIKFKTGITFLAPPSRVRQRQERESRVQVARGDAARHRQGHQVWIHDADAIYQVLLAAAARPPARLQGINIKQYIININIH